MSDEANSNHPEVLEKAAGRLSHEIKNSLTGISGALQVLRDRLSPDVDYGGILERIDAELRRIEVSVEELARFSSPKRPVLVRRNLHDVIERALSRAPLGASTRIHRRYQDGLPPVAVDERLLGQAIERLIVNAQEAMPSGGVLTISTQWDEHRVLVSIHDTGDGIPDGTLESIFEPFFTSKMRGLGLGLAISRTLVQAHGGSLSVASPQGNGTEFVIALPRQ